MAKVKAALNVRFQGVPQPDIVFTDRGQGFYRTNGGKITPEYKQALQQHGLKAHAGNNASAQPGNLQEVMLHETAVAWIRQREAVTQQRKPWKETVGDYQSRLRSICEYINDNYDVEGLCRDFPKRVLGVVEAEGGRVSW